jgi:hypothetical protein
MITKCDLCKKQIKNDKERITAGKGYWPGSTLCLACGKPVIKFLEKNKLIEKSK